jgi:hypothetical protein
MGAMRSPAAAGILLLLLAACGEDTIQVEKSSATAQVGAATPAPRTSTATPTATATRSPTASPTITPTPSASPSGGAATCEWSVCIDSPDASAVITSPVRVTGNAAVEGGAVTIEIRQSGRDSPLLGSATTTATAAAPDRGTFSVSVTFSPSGQQARMYAFATRRPAQYSWIVVRFS